VLLLDDQGRVLAWDGAAEAILGYPADEVIGRYAQDVLPGLGPPDEFWGRSLAGGCIDLRGLTQDGREILLEAMLTPFERGHDRLVAAVLRQPRASRTEGQPGLLYDRLAAVGELAAGMAHDYNNVLGTIILYSEMVLGSRGLGRLERARVEVILEQAKRAAQLTSQVLDFTRRSDMERRPMDLQSLLAETRNLLENILPPNMSIGATFEGDRFVVDGDPGRLQQAVMNLAINARDAMPAGGQLTFHLERFRLKPEEPSPYRDMKPGEWVRLEVRDTGTGIPSNMLPHIFEPFFTTKAAGKGTGLGLAQVYGIVKRHDGYVDVRSHLGAGTTFTLYLPFDPRPLEAMPKGIGANPDVNEPVVTLVIEDDEGTRPALVQVLESMGHTVYSVATGVAGAETLERLEGNVDVVVCDVHLPDDNGWELSLRLGQRWPRPRFVLISGYSPGLETRVAVPDSRFRWLSKPFTIADLGAALRAAKG
jgi:PAS domain S-box-containing protein